MSFVTGMHEEKTQTEQKKNRDCNNVLESPSPAGGWLIQTITGPQQADKRAELFFVRRSVTQRRAVHCAKPYSLCPLKVSRLLFFTVRFIQNFCIIS
jgi:hypothetical protein